MRSLGLLLLPPLLLLALPLHLLFHAPFVLRVLEGSELEALGDRHLVDARELEVAVDGVEQVVLELGDEGVF